MLNFRERWQLEMQIIEAINVQQVRHLLSMIGHEIQKHRAGGMISPGKPGLGKLHFSIYGISLRLLCRGDRVAQMTAMLIQQLLTGIGVAASPVH